MAAEPPKATKIFYCYAHEDETLRDQLEKHLKPFERLKQIAQWYDGKIKPGMEWERELKMQLKTADIVLLLVSPDFFNSDYCYCVEMTQALERQKIGDTCVIPIILRPVAWEETPIGKLQGLPSNAKPITTWSNQDEALLDVAKGVQDRVAAFLFRKMQTLVKEGEAYRGSGQHAEALTAFERAMYLDPRNLITDRSTTSGLIASANEQALAVCEEALAKDPHSALLYKRKADILQNLVHHEEALKAYAKAIDLMPNNALFSKCKADLCMILGRYEEAIKDYDSAIRLDPRNTSLYKDKLDALSRLGHYHSDFGRYEEALAAYNQAIHLDPGNALFYQARGNTLSQLSRYEEALAAYDRAIHLDPDNASFYESKGDALSQLNRFEEALAFYDQAIHLGPENLSLQNKVELFKKLHRNEEALTIYDQIIQRSPTIASYREKAAFLKRLQLYDEALAVYELIIQQWSDEPSTYYEQSKVLQTLRRFGEARKAYEAYKAAKERDYY